MGDTVTAEQLLADAAWLKRLAITLAGDETDADDLVQESWISVAVCRMQDSESSRAIGGTRTPTVLPTGT